MFVAKFFSRPSAFVSLLWTVHLALFIYQKNVEVYVCLYIHTHTQGNQCMILQD